MSTVLPVSRSGVGPYVFPVDTMTLVVCCLVGISIELFWRLEQIGKIMVLY